MSWWTDLCHGSQFFIRPMPVVEPLFVLLLLQLSQPLLLLVFFHVRPAFVQHLAVESSLVLLLNLDVHSGYPAPAEELVETRYGC